jgi:hypothetical protein
MLNVCVFWDMPLCRCPSISDVSENCNDVFMVKRSVQTPGIICPTTWLSSPADLNLGHNIAVRTSNLKSYTAQRASNLTWFKLVHLECFLNIFMDLRVNYASNEFLDFKLSPCSVCSVFFWVIPRCLNLFRRRGRSIQVMNLSASEIGNFSTTQACKKNPSWGTMLSQFHFQILSPCISKTHHNVILPPLGLPSGSFPNFSPQKR